MADAPPPLARAYTPSALPSVTARLLAFLAILLGGLCGGLIGYAVVDLQCGASNERVVLAPGDSQDSTTTTSTTPPPADDEGCGAVNGAGGVAGAVLGAGGVAVISVLVLRAMAEWRRDLDVEELPPPATRS